MEGNKMTEQEKREKAIEEMAHIVVSDCKNTCKNCGIYGWCIGFFNATRFYDADYRKKEEVQKETAKEIKKTLSFELEENGIVDFTNSIRDEKFKVVFNRVFKKFGVELE